MYAIRSYYAEINQLSGIKNALPIVKRLLDYNALFVNEHLKESYKPKVEKMVSLHAECSTETMVQKAFGLTERAPKP